MGLRGIDLCPICKSFHSCASPDKAQEHSDNITCIFDSNIKRECANE